MNKNTTYIIMGAASLIALVSMSSALSLSSQNKAAKAEILALQTQIVNMEAFTPDRSSDPEIIYLTAEGNTNAVTALQLQLAETEALLEDLQSTTNRPTRQPRESFEDRMAQRKAEDPEGYAEMIQNRQERQDEMKYNLAERTATFMDLDTSGMTPEERANHELLINKMATIWEMSEMLNDPEQGSDREAMREMAAVAREIQPLMDIERTVMFEQLGSDLGYEGEDSSAFATHLEAIIESTSLQVPGGRGGRGGGGR
ncbi:MAG: hypothetical protein V5783_02345 [Pontiella sp.]